LVVVKVVNRADKKLAKAIKLGQKRGSKAVEIISEKGLKYAKQIAPKYTGKTSQFIRRIRKKTKDGLEITIVSPKRQLNDTGPNSIINRKYKGSLPRFLHSQDYVNSVRNKTGKPYYMFETRDYLLRIKRNVAKGVK